MARREAAVPRPKVTRVNDEIEKEEEEEKRKLPLFQATPVDG
jgi:hypothetical protein